MMLVRRKIYLLPLIAGLCACAGGDARYPSLSMRPFETGSPASQPTTSPAPAPDVADAATIAALVERATLSHEGFTRQEPAAARLARAAAGQPIESDARGAALVAMADLAAQRAATSGALADLDLLAVQASTTFAPVTEIDTARQQIAALVSSEDAAIARLWETMGQ